jgi:hypothetical protein
MTDSDPTLLRALLRSRHLQEHRAFTRAYERVTKELDGGKGSQPPSKATFYRWLAGGVSGLPHPDHCRVLEAMFPGYTVAALLAPWDSTRALPVHSGPSAGQESELPRRAQFSDLVSAFSTRAEFIEAMPPRSLFDRASTIQAVGLSLNLLCQQYGDQLLHSALNQGTCIQAPFLDPDGRAMAERESEEGHAAGGLAGLTRLNMQALQRMRAELPHADQERVEVRTYDETVRFNITLIDGHRCVFQPYMPAMRGIDSPTFVVRRRGDGVGMFGTFERVFTSHWDAGTTCD